MSPVRRGRLRLNWHWALPAVAGAVVVLAAGFVTGLRGQAVQASKTVEQLLEVRRLTSDTDAIGWQLVAQGFPNFTFSQTLRQDAATINSNLRLLDRAGTPLSDVKVEFRGLEQQVGAEERLISAKRLNQAMQVMLDGVDGTAQILRASVERLRAVYAARAAPQTHACIGERWVCWA